MDVLVTGGGGFLGRAVVRALARRGDRVVAIDAAIGPRLRELAEREPAVTPLIGHLDDAPQLTRIFERTRPDKVVHCAAVVGVPNSIDAPVVTMRVNVEGSLNLFEAMRLFGIGRVVHISSEEVYGPFESRIVAEEAPCRPEMPYGISKLTVEQLGRSYGELYGLECVNIRTCWLYGPDFPRPRPPMNLLDAAIAGRSCHLPSGRDFRVDHVYVEDAVQGVLLALDKEQHAFDVYNIATGRAPSLGEIATIIRDLVPGADLSVADGDYRIDARIPPARKGALDITRAREQLGYAPHYDIRSGIFAYLEAGRGRA